MTGLANRRTFDERLIVELKRARREKEPLSVTLIDIDEFKKFNDHFGHIEGDDCIKSIASSLGMGLKRSTDLAARYGGEEFAFILPNTDAEGAKTLLSSLLKSIEHLNLSHAPEAKYDVVTISIGFSTIKPELKYENNSDDWAVVKAADHALFKSKENGRNQVSYESLDSH